MTIFGHLNSLCIPADVFFTHKCPANRLPWHLNNILLFNVSGTIFVWWLCLLTHFQILFLIGLFGAISTLVFIFSSLLFNYILFFCVFLYFFVLYFLYFFSAFPLISLSRAFIQISPFSCSMANFRCIQCFYCMCLARRDYFFCLWYWWIAFNAWCIANGSLSVVYHVSCISLNFCNAYSTAYSSITLFSYFLCTKIDSTANPEVSV